MVMRWLFSVLFTMAMCLREETAMRTITQQDSTDDMNATGFLPFDHGQRVEACQQVKGIDDQYCPTRPCKATTNFPVFGDNTVNHLGYKDIVQQLAQVPDWQRAGTIVRGNDLGMCALYEDLWRVPWRNGKIPSEPTEGHEPFGYRTIFLGADVDTHQYVRPILDAVLGVDSNAWSYEWILGKTQEYMAQQDIIDMNKGKDIPVFITKLLHKIHLNMDMSDKAARDFSVWQNKFLMQAVLSGLSSVIAVGATGGTMGSSLAQQRVDIVNGYMDAIIDDTRTDKDGNPFFPAELKIKEQNNEHKREGGKLYNVAAAMFDSLVFAGGLSVVQGIETAISLLFAQHLHFPVADGILPLQQDDVEAFVYEVYRLFPQVVGFPWWSPEDDAGNKYNGNRRHGDGDGNWHYTKRTIMNIATGLRDPEAWGSNSREFALRYDDDKTLSDETKTMYGLAWVEQTNKKVNGKLDPMSRGCPGQGLSIALTKAFVATFVEQQNHWIAGKVGQSSSLKDAVGETGWQTGGIAFIDTAPFHEASPTLVQVPQHGMLDVDGEKKYAYLEHYPDKEGFRLTLYPRAESGASARVPDDPSVGLEEWFLESGRAYAYGIYKESSDDACMTLEKVVPWGPFSGKALTGPWKFCVPGELQESKAVRDEWYGRLRALIKVTGMNGRECVAATEKEGRDCSDRHYASPSNEPAPPH